MPPAFPLNSNGFQNHCKMSGRQIRAVRPGQVRLICVSFTAPTRGGYVKKQLFTLLGLGLMLASAAAYAQTVNVKVNIPFKFVVRDATLPSGEYTIGSLGMSSDAISIRNLNQKAQSLTLSQRCESLKASAQTKLVFHRYGDRYFLSQIWVAGSTAGRELTKSREEVEVAQDYTMQNVILVASLR
jgi:hypothetical protein